MLDESALTESQDRFIITGPTISEEEINLVFSESFPGREDLVQFYLRSNGGSRTTLGGTVYFGDLENECASDEANSITVEGFYSIQRDAQEKSPGLLSMLKHRTLMSQKCDRYPQLKAFVEQHMPIAFDDCGNEFWIDIKNGCVRYLLVDSMLKGPIDVATSFQEFIHTFWINGRTSDIQ